MAYQAWSVTFGEQPSAAKWNILGTNDAAFNSGGGVLTAGLADDAVTAQKMIYGMVRNRQGNTTGDNTWLGTGTNNTDTSAKNIFMQVGYRNGSAAGAVSVTFPTAFNYPPLVFLTVELGNGTGYFATIDSNPTTTGFTFATWSNSSTLVAVAVAWLAIGQ